MLTPNVIGSWVIKNALDFGRT